MAAVVDELESAAQDADGGSICIDLFTTNLAISVAKASGGSCADEVVENIFQDDASFEIEDLALRGRSATVRVKDQDDRESVLLMVKSGPNWRIAKVS